MEPAFTLSTDSREAKAAIGRVNRPQLPRLTASVAAIREALSMTPAWLDISAAVTNVYLQLSIQLRVRSWALTVYLAFWHMPATVRTVPFNAPYAL